MRRDQPHRETAGWHTYDGPRRVVTDLFSTDATLPSDYAPLCK